MKINWNGEKRNLVGPKVKELRKKRKVTQKDMAAQLQVMGYDFNDLTILRIEQQTRFVSDIEVDALARYFNITIEPLFRDADN